MEKSLTLGQLFDLYMEYAMVHCETWQNMNRCFNSYLSEWDSRPTDEITRLDVQTLHNRLGLNVGKTTANRVIQLLRAIYNQGLNLQIINCRNPAVGIRMFKLQPRERFFDQQELDRLFKAIETLRYRSTQDFLLMCLYTAARRSNVAAMRWDEINFNLSTWRIPKTKNGESQIVPLTPEAMALLASRYPGKSPWVFPSSRSRTGHLTKPEEAWRMVLQRAGISNARIHDLRRTLASWQAITGANMAVIARTLNHKDMKSTSIYARLQIDPVRQAMVKATSVMLGRNI